MRSTLSALPKDVAAAQRPVLEEHRAAFDRKGVSARLAHGVAHMHARGDEPQEITEPLKLSAKTVEKILTFNEFDLITILSRQAHLAPARNT